MQGLFSATLGFQRTYDFDLVKVTPSSSYCIKDWGVDDEWRGASEGTRDYTRRAIHNPEDWARLPVLDPNRGRLAEQLNCLRILVKELGPETPVIQTIFNPLSQAKNLVGREELFVHMRRFPDALQEGLKIITTTTSRFIEAIRATGIAGIFFAVQHAQYSLMSEGEYDIFGRRFDFEVLEEAQSMWLRMLHLHGTEVMFDRIQGYPVNILNWHDRETPPSLNQAQARFTGVVCGGISRNTIVYGTPEQLRAEAMEAIQSTSGQRFILGTGCVTPIIAPYGNILALRQCVE